jgi:heme exporter protein B
MIRDALLVAEKDLRIEWRSKVTASQIAPFGILVLVLFALALDNIVAIDPGDSNRPKPGSLPASTITSGLFWLAVLFGSVLAIQRSFTVETADGAADNLRLSSLDPAGIFLGKATAIAVQLFALELVLGFCALLFFPAVVSNPFLFVVAAIFATIGLVTVGTCYGALSAGIRSRDTLLPLLYFPIVMPVLLGAVKATQVALSSEVTSEVGVGWSWVRLLVVFAVIYTAVGILIFGLLLEEA